MRWLRSATILLSVFVSAPVAASDPTMPVQDRGWSADLSIGAMNGEANELVYNPDGSTLSRLIWTFDNVVVLNGALSYRWNWLTLGAKGRINLTDDSTMDDYDFPGLICGIPGPFCRSHHENTTLEHSRMLDLHASAAFLRANGITMEAVAGYKWDNNSWVAVGGTSNYAPPFPNIPVISYEQWWQAPYLGLAATAGWDKWRFGGRVIGSIWAKGHDEDDHHLRTLLFKENFDRSDMLAVNLEAGYEIMHGTSLTLGYDYERYFTAKGPTTILDYSTGATAFIPGDAAGGNSETQTVTVGVKIDF